MKIHATEQYWSDLGKALSHWAAGHPIQKWDAGAGEWVDFPANGNPRDAHLMVLDLRNMGRFRVKPEPATRPWSKPEHVPGPVCWFRTSQVGSQELITRISYIGIEVGGTSLGWGDLSNLNLTAEYSTDRKTWLPCVVVEQE